MQRALNYDLTPRLSVPLRFFLTALLFALLSCLLLLWAGAPALSSRWTPALLAMTHLWLLGCATLTIIGALFQLLPVVGGRALPKGNLYANSILACVSGAALLLPLAFLSGIRPLFPLAASLATAGLIIFLLGCLRLFTRSDKPLAEGAKPMYRALSMALCFLALVLFSGVINAMLRSGSIYAHQWISSTWLTPLQLTDTHATVGLMGWIVLMVIAVAPQVIPIFQVTEAYPSKIEQRLSSLFAVALLSWLLSVLLALPSWTQQATEAASVLTCLAFALFSLKTLKTRKRPEHDATTGFWYVAMLCLLLSCLAWILGGTHTQLLSGMLLAGFAFSAINGMLYQILPFLIWLHAHRHANKQRPVMPKMRNIIPLRSARLQCGLHSAALILLAGATIQPGYLTRPAALLMLVSVLWLCANLWHALRIYDRALKSLHQQEPAQAST